MTATEVRDLGSELIRLLTQQRLLYRQLKELAQKQRPLLDGANPEMLLRLLAGRQRLVDRLAEIARQLKPLREQWQQIAAGLPAEQRAEAQGLVGEVQAILGEILARDEEDTRVLQQQQAKVAAELQGATAGRRMHQAYGQSQGAAQSRFLDTLSE